MCQNKISTEFGITEREYEIMNTHVGLLHEQSKCEHELVNLCFPHLNGRDKAVIFLLGCKMAENRLKILSFSMAMENIQRGNFRGAK